MKRLIISLLGLVCLSLSLESCETSYASVGYGSSDNYYASNIDNVDVSVIVRYGTPYYYNGYLNYYCYRGLYYYPFYYNNLWYLRPYYKPFRPGYFPPYRTWRPRRNWKGYDGFGRPSNRGRVFAPNGNYQHHNRNTMRNNNSRSFGGRIGTRSSTRLGNEQSKQRNFGNGKPRTYPQRQNGTFVRPRVNRTFGGGNTKANGGHFDRNR